MFGFGPFATFFIIVILLLISGIKILKEYDRAVIFRLGRMVDPRGPGITYVIPFIEKMIRVDLRIAERWNVVRLRGRRQHRLFFFGLENLAGHTSCRSMHTPPCHIATPIFRASARISERQKSFSVEPVLAYIGHLIFHASLVRIRCTSDLLDDVTPNQHIRVHGKRHLNTMVRTNRHISGERQIETRILSGAWVQS